MIVNEGGNARNLFTEKIHSDLVIVGGGMSGVCCAITAAREGLRVTLVQDRPVLGGNASSEVRLWILGATSHMGNNNRWAREGGVIDELLVENMYRNPEGNPVIFDSILLEKIVEEKNIRLFLNTAVYEVVKNGADSIASVKGFCSQNQTEYTFQAPYFCDASGDGVMAFLAGASFRMGAESKEEFQERFAPSQEYGELLGHSIYFYSRDTGRPVQFTPPSFALKDIQAIIPRYKSFDLQDQGCKLWWIEYGGRLDTVKEAETIKWELWRIIYGVWNYIKNSGNFPDAANYTLEWVGTIPGKRESRRFMGDYMLIQQDVVEQRHHDDAVSFGGWSIDLHPADGVFSELPGCNQWHSKGIFGIPYRCMYSRNISNLFLTGRIMSASHVAFGSTRVMGTSANNAQAVAVAAVMARERQLLPSELCGHIQELQQRLLKTGQFIPGIKNKDPKDLVQQATLSASSEYNLLSLPENGDLYPLETGMAQLLPVSPGKLPVVRFHLHAGEKTTLHIHLAASSRQGNYTPDLILEERTLSLERGPNCIELEWETTFTDHQYAFIILRKNSAVSAYVSDTRVTGMLSLFQAENKAVSNTGVQTPPEDIGVDAFEFWTPKRRPAGKNMAISFSKPLHTYTAENIHNGYARPYLAPNAWAAALTDASPQLVIKWAREMTIQTIHLSFDTDLDHPMESVLMQHPENVMPFCIRNYSIYDGSGKLIKKITDNHQTRNIIIPDEPLVTDRLVVQCEHPAAHVPAAIFEIRCY